VEPVYAVGCFLFVVAAVVLIAFLGGRATGHAPVPPQQRRPRRCAGCGIVFDRTEERCPQCQLDPLGDVAAELRDLTATARVVQALRVSGGLDPAVCEQVYRCVEGRQHRLLDIGLAEAAAHKPEVVALPQHLDERAAPQRKREPLLAVRVEPAQIADAPVAAAPVVAPAPPAPPAPDDAAPRGLWAWLAVFMEERHVLWGELVGGMLIVGCSIALVISLWQTLERVPLFPFLILAGLTSALLGAGFYTLSHWKLQTTSRGLLLIGMLLVP